MEGGNYYQKNLETGKLNVYTTKAFYDALSSEQKDVFTRFCLWSKYQQCWISKGKAEGCYYLKTQLTAMGFTEKENTGEKLSFEDQVNKERERAAKQADVAEKRAEKADQKSDELYNRAKEMASAIPFGQPILIGHHSEKSDRNYRNRIHNTFGKAFEEQDKAKYYEQKADNARKTAEGKRFKDPVYLARHINECEKNLRLLERRLLGKFYVHSKPEEINQEARDFYTGRIAEEKDKLQFLQKCMKEVNPEWSGGIETTSKRQKKSPGKGHGR